MSSNDLTVTVLSNTSKSNPTSSKAIDTVAKILIFRFDFFFVYCTISIFYYKRKLQYITKVT